MICERIAGRVGGQIERAEAELQRAHDELEARSRERTARTGRRGLRRASQPPRPRGAPAGPPRIEADAVPDAPAGEDGQPRPDRRRRRPRDQQPAGLRHQQPRSSSSARSPACTTSSASTSRPSRPSTSTSATCTAEIPDLSEEVDLPYVLENLDGLLDRSRDGPAADPEDRRGPPRLRPPRRGRLQGGRPQRRDRRDGRTSCAAWPTTGRRPGDRPRRRSPG